MGPFFDQFTSLSTLKVVGTLYVKNDNNELCLTGIQQWSFLKIHYAPLVVVIPAPFPPSKQSIVWF